MKNMTNWIIWIALISTMGYTAGQCPVPEKVSHCSCIYSNRKGQRVPEAIICEGNGLPSLPAFSASKQVFRNIIIRNSDVKEIRMERSPLISLTKWTFSNLTALQRLDISNTHLHDIEIETLSNKSSLEVVNLFFNNITDLKPHFLSNLIELTVLDLSYNKLKRLPSDVFQNQKMLENLWLQSNNLNILDYNCFSGLKNLDFLDLRFNNIRVLPARVFDPLENVRVMYLSYNALDDIHAAHFFSNRKLTELYLKNNKIKQITPGCFRGQKSLKSLDLSYNHIISISKESFYPITKLARLYLDRNNINNLEPNMFRYNLNLKVIKLSNNPLRVLPEGSFTGPNNLQEVYLDHCMLTEMAAGVFDPIRPAPNPGQGVSSVTLLDLSNNAISRMNANALKSLNNVLTLKLAHNMLTWETFNSEFVHLTNVRSLDVSYNNFSRLDRALVHSKPDLVDLFTAGNPLHCDCSSAWLRGYPVIQDLDVMLCASPDPLLGRHAACFNLTAAGCPAWPVHTYIAEMCRANDIFPEVDFTTAITPTAD